MCIEKKIKEKGLNWEYHIICMAKKGCWIV
jgi:hypothetical protein